MSETLFDNTDDQGGEQTQQTQEDNYLDQVVTARGENWKDPNVLAKGYLSSQQHIAQIEAENAELREKATKNDYMKEVLERIEEGKAKPASGEPTSQQNTSTQNTDNQGTSVEQIKSLVAETLTEQEAQRTAAQNVQETKRQLQEAFGTEASNKLKQVMSELSMTQERMDQLAAESPSAFMRLVGAPQKKETNSDPSSSVNTQGTASTPSGKKNWAYWQKLRRENPKLYREARTQREMLEARESMGSEEFYGTG